MYYLDKYLIMLINQFLGSFSVLCILMYPQLAVLNSIADDFMTHNKLLFIHELEKEPIFILHYLELPAN